MQELGGTREACGRSDLSEDVKADGEADWMGASLEQFFLRGFVIRAGLSKCPGFQAKAVCWRIRLSCSGMWFGCVFESWKLAGYGA